MLPTNEIKPIQLNLNVKDNNIKVYVLSDLHLGDPNCNLSLAKEIVSFIKDTPNCYAILLGDILNTAIKQSKSDVYSDTMNVAQAQEYAIELLTPIKEKILAICPGNHENRIWREVGVDITAWLADKLGLRDRYVSNFLALSLVFGMDVDGRSFRFNIAGQHGAYGSGRKLGAALNALEDMDEIVNNADLYIRAHTHAEVQGSRKVFTFNHLGGVEFQTKYYFNAPSVLNYGGYGAEKGYKPQDDTPCYLNIRAVSTRKNSKTLKTFKIDKIQL